MNVISIEQLILDNFMLIHPCRASAFSNQRSSRASVIERITLTFGNSSSQVVVSVLLSLIHLFNFCDFSFFLLLGQNDIFKCTLGVFSSHGNTISQQCHSGMNILNALALVVN
jgi:hypothetical protein